MAAGEAAADKPNTVPRSDVCGTVEVDYPPREARGDNRLSEELPPPETRGNM